jgi:hypothetical protein
MFSLQDIKEYWCAISVNDDGDDVRVMRTSDDLNKDDALSFSNGIEMDDTPIDDEWFNAWIEETTTVSGVYKLALDPVYEETKAKDDGEETTRRFDYFKVIEVSLLYKLEI